MDIWGLVVGVLLVILLLGRHAQGKTLGALRVEMYELRTRIRRLEAGEAADEQPPAPTVKEQLPPIVYADSAPPELRAQAAPAARVMAAKPAAATEESGWAFNLTARLPVWIGAVALACAAFYLVRYSVEAGWFGPGMRVAGGGILGALLTLTGDWIGRAKTMANHERVAQGLVGAGLAAMYGAFYAAVSIYHFLPPFAGVLCMTAVTMGAVVMALRHGQPIALFGLIAGMATPALVGSDDPQALMLFSHLFAVFAVGLMILARRDWWGLAGVMLAGMYGWAALWVLDEGQGSEILAVFVLAVAGALAFAVRGAPAVTGVKLNAAAIGGAALVLAMMDMNNALGLFEWAMMIVLALGTVALATVRQESYRGVLLTKAALDIVVLYLWGADTDTSSFLMVMAGLGAVYVALPQLLMRRAADPRSWALLQGLSLGALYAVAHAHVPGVDDVTWALIAMAFAVMALWRMLGYVRGEGAVAEHMTAIYCAGTVGFVTTTLFLVLPADMLAAALAAKAALLLWLHRRTDMAVLPALALMLAAGVFMALFEPLMILIERMFDGIVQDRTPVALPGVAWDVYLLPGAAMLAGGLIYKGPSRAVAHVMLGLGSILLAGFAYAAACQMDSVPEFVRSGLFGAAMAVMAIGLVYNGGRAASWGRAWIAAVIARIVYLDMLVANPAFIPVDVGGLPVLNGVTLVFGTGALLCLYAVASTRIGLGRGARNVYALLGFAMLFALVTLTVRQIGAGGGTLYRVPVESMEFYGYSVVWLLTGLALLAFGMIARSRKTQIAGGLFIALCVGKVFIYDAAALDGLYRVFSFFGLGFSLIALSVFCTRYAARLKGEEEKAQEVGPWDY